MIRIGLIDDNTTERDDIQTTIYTAWQNSHDIPEEKDVQFKLYELAPRQSFKEELKKELLHDIDRRYIQSLIVDYKLDSLRKVIAGKDIVEFLNTEVPAFPVIILTNAPGGSQKEPVIDPDKVYDKNEFFYLGSEASNKMALKIYLNIQRYLTRRSELEAKRERMLEELSTHPDADVDIELLSKITEIDYELSNYTTTEKTTVEKAVNLSELRNLISDLIELEEKMS